MVRGTYFPLPVGEELSASIAYGKFRTFYRVVIECRTVDSNVPVSEKNVLNP